MREDSVTVRCQRGDSHSGALRSRLAGALLVIFVSAAQAIAATDSTTTIPQAQQREVEQGVQWAQACEGEIDADLQPYVACIEHRLVQRKLTPATRAGLHLQAWLMADLALQQSSNGAASARKRWWRALQRDLARSRLSLDQLCGQRGLSCADLRLRAARSAPA